MNAPTAVYGRAAGLRGVKQLLKVNGVVRVAEDRRVDGLVGERGACFDPDGECDDRVVTEAAARK
eukprot:5431183-Pyramimonas_sp.AAC.1